MILAAALAAAVGAVVWAIASGSLEGLKEGLKERFKKITSGAKTELSEKESQAFTTVVNVVPPPDSVCRIFQDEQGGVVVATASLAPAFITAEQVQLVTGLNTRHPSASLAVRQTRYLAGLVVSPDLAPRSIPPNGCASALSGNSKSLSRSARPRKTGSCRWLEPSRTIFRSAFNFIPDPVQPRRMRPTPSPRRRSSRT